LAKIVVTGTDRVEALERARRALDEMVVEGLATVLGFHRLVVRDPDFVDEPFRVHTRWIETEWDNPLTPYEVGVDEPGPSDTRTTVVVEVSGRRLEVTLPAGFAVAAGAKGEPQPGSVARRADLSRRNGATSTSAPAGRGRGARRERVAAASGAALTSPMQGTIVKVGVSEGDMVAVGDLIVVLEAMKMEQPLQAHRAGVVTGLTAQVGVTVGAGTVICEIT
jgi:acetyl-CoA/propionyl-CoA carboxylase biotin carboxyl carrier protein